jgi:hypothetical protein
VGTLMVVLLITSLKELAEDLQRGKSDSYENTRLIKVVTFDERGNPVETEKMSKYIRPGDIVKLEGESGGEGPTLSYLHQIYMLLNWHINLNSSIYVWIINFLNLY